MQNEIAPQNFIKSEASLRMADNVFWKLSELIHRESGIHLQLGKKILLEGRVRKRLKHLGLSSFERYLDFVLSAGKEEWTALIDVVTTNKTDFLREPQQFDFLVKNILPAYLQSRQGGRKIFQIWSAACSSGEEPYTMAMVLSEYAAANPGFEFSVLATDISTRILEQAKKGIYDQSRVDPIPLDWRKKYLLKSCRSEYNLVRICPEIREKVRFERLNLIHGDHGAGRAMDVIFCRNVIIYFDRPTQQKVVQNLYRQLAPGGYLFMGHSETLNKINAELSYVKANIYQKPPA